MAIHLQATEIKARSELRCLGYLQSKLPQNWVILGNVEAEINDGRASFEIDAIVIGDDFIWVIDFKDYKAPFISGDKTVWYLSNDRMVKNPINRILHRSRIIKGLINRMIEDTENLWVQGIVLLFRECDLSGIEDPRVPHHILQVEGCERYFSDPGLQRRPYPIDEDLRRSLVCALAGASKASEYDRHINKAQQHPEPAIPAYSIPDSKSIYSVTITGSDGFYRFFSSDDYNWVLLCRDTLRGFAPLKELDRLGTGGVRIQFEDRRLKLSAVKCRAFLDSGPIDDSVWIDAGGYHMLDVGENSMNIRYKLEATL